MDLLAVSNILNYQVQWCITGIITQGEGAKLQAQENRDAAQKKIIKETSVFPESTPSSSGIVAAHATGFYCNSMNCFML